MQSSDAVLQAVPPNFAKATVTFFLYYPPTCQDPVCVSVPRFSLRDLRNSSQMGRENSVVDMSKRKKVHINCTEKLSPF